MVEKCDRHLDCSDRNIANQVERIELMVARGKDATFSLQLLETFRRLRLTHLTHRDDLVVRLGDLRSSEAPAAKAA
jgi:hypothetical protein